jgi:hypothetical protein
LGRPNCAGSKDVRRDRLPNCRCCSILASRAAPSLLAHWREPPSFVGYGVMSLLGLRGATPLLARIGSAVAACLPALGVPLPLAHLEAPGPSSRALGPHCHSLFGSGSRRHHASESGNRRHDSGSRNRRRCASESRSHRHASGLGSRRRALSGKRHCRTRMVGSRRSCIGVGCQKMSPSTLELIL